jgi:hypothetical protein
MDVSGDIRGPATLPLENEPLAHNVQEAGQAPELFWTLWSKQQPFAWNRTAVGQPVTVNTPTELS